MFKRTRSVGRTRSAPTPFVHTLRALVALAWPIAMAMAGETVMGLVDTKLVGALGRDALGGVGMAMTLALLGYLFVLGLMRGIKVCVAHAMGQGRVDLTLRFAQAGIVLGAAGGFLVWAATRDAGPALRLLGVDPALIPYAVTFLSTFTYGAPATAITAALTNHRQAIGDSRSPMAVGLAGNVVNALLGWSLIYGHLGLPALGVRGAALATVTAEVLEASILVALLTRDARRLRVSHRVGVDLSLRAAARAIAAVGVPTGLQFGAEMLAMVACTAIIGRLGADQMAAHQVALATIRTSFLPGVAVSEAASVLVSQALGRRSIDEADRIARAALVVAVSFMATCGVIFALGADAIVGAFTRDETVVRVARKLLHIAAAFQVVDAVAIVYRGTLRGARDVRVPALVAVAATWACLPTAAIVLGQMLGWGAAGGWYGILAETTLGSGLFALRWRRGSWRKAYEGAPGDLGGRAPCTARAAGPR